MTLPTSGQLSFSAITTELILPNSDASLQGMFVRSETLNFVPGVGYPISSFYGYKYNNVYLTSNEENFSSSGIPFPSYIPIPYTTRPPDATLSYTVSSGWITLIDNVINSQLELSVAANLDGAREETIRIELSSDSATFANLKVTQSASTTTTTTGTTGTGTTETMS